MDRVNNGIVDFMDDSWWMGQIAVATESFYGSSNGIRDIVFVFREKQEYGNENTCSSGKI